MTRSHAGAPPRRAVARERATWSAAGRVLAVGATLLAACAPPAAIVPGGPAVYVDAPFAADGRLSARRGDNAVAVSFAWEHRPPRDALTVTSPLGQTVAELSGDSQTHRVEVRTADGRHAEASDWTTLTEEALGFPLPVAGLAAWVRGSPQPGSAHAVETDAQGRVALLRQEGWEIVYDYPDASARLPGRLRITYPGLEIRVVIVAWR